MKKQLLISGIVVAAAIFTIGYGASAMAGWGRGGGYGGCGGPGARWNGAGYGVTSMSAEQYKQLDEQRQSFFGNTADLRQQIYQKDLDLRGELAKADPDTAKASRLQKVLSRLEADLEQKRFEHMMATRKVNPDAGRGGYGRRGPGPGYAGDCPGAGGGQRCW